MFVYFDKNGTLKEIISDKKFRVGDNKKDKIYIYWDGEHYPLSGWVKYRKANGQDYPESVEECFFELGDSLVGKELPQEPLRNLKYFSYDHTYVENGQTKVGYLFYEITVPEEVLNSALPDNEEVPNENNLIIARFRFVLNDEEVMSLGALVFSVETNIGILTDSSINETQYNYLIRLLSTKIGFGISSVKVNALPTIGNAGIIYYLRASQDGIIYDAYIWNGSHYVFLGTTSYGIYSKKDGEDFENAVRVMLATEMSQFTGGVNEELAAMNTAISNIVSGSPKGVYASLSDLQTAYPTGTTGIYVTSDTGKWYFWNGSVWTEGGVYQSSVGVVPNTRKVADYPLSADISVKDLKEKLYVYLMNLWSNGNFLVQETIPGSSATRTVADGVLKVLATAKYGWAGKTFSFTAGDKVYCSMKVKCNIATNRDVAVNFQKQSGSQQILFRHFVETDNEWVRYSGYATVEETGDDYRFQVYDNRSSDFTEIDVDDCIVCNLTQSFGAGHEIGYDEIDALVARNYGYFHAYEYISFVSLYEKKFDKSIYYEELIDENYDFSVLSNQDVMINIIPTALYGVFNYSNGRATLKKLLKVNSGTRFYTSGSLTFLLYMYDENMTLIGTSGDGYIKDYTVEQDCYVRLVYGNNNVNDLRTMFNIDIPKKMVRESRINPDEIIKSFSLFPKVVSPQFATFNVAGHQGNRQFGVGNTIPAIIGARKSNFAIVEGDVRKNIYGEYFMYHDDNMLPSSFTFDGYAYDVNGYIIYKDGSGNYYFYDGTNAQLYTYDYANKKYVGSEVDVSTLTVVRYRQIVVNNEKVEFMKRVDTNYSYPYVPKGHDGVLTFKEWLLLCRKLGMKCAIDRKFTATQETYEELAQIVIDTGMKNNVYWVVSGTLIAGWIRVLLPTAKLIVDFNDVFPNISTQSDIVALKIDGIDDALIVEAQAGKVGNEYVITEENAKSWLEQGIVVGAWNYLQNTQTKEEMTKEIDRLIDCGVSFFTWDIYSPYELMNEKYGVYSKPIIDKIK